MTLAVQFDCTAERVIDIPPTAFIPRPQVTSTVLKIRRRERPAVEVKDRKLFFSLVKMGFGQRRKVFTNAIKAGGISADMVKAILEKRISTAPAAERPSPWKSMAAWQMHGMN